jgi:MtrB/PioB family decaheme-associated outer membrane protein
VFSAAVLLLLSSGVARAQQRAVAPVRSGSLIFGARGSSVDGDEARWERYRDLRDGILSKVALGRETTKDVFKFGAANIGYHDQQYTAGYNKYGKLKLSATWNSTPLNYAYNTLTPWKDAGGNVWTLNTAARTDVQNKVPGVLGIGTNAGAFNTASIYRGLATVFAMQSRRDVMGLGVNYRFTKRASMDVAFSSTKKSGNQPYGASFAFNNSNELPMALDNRTNDVNLSFEWAKPTTGMVRVAWTGSWFKNKFQSLTWDNPLRATDFSNGKTPPNGPYDANGYSNGNGAAVGRLALPPSNSLSSFSLVGLYKMPGHSTLNGTVSITTMKQNEALIPWTTNTQIANDAVYALFPGLRTLPRASAEAEVRGVNAILNFATRPTDFFSFDMRYRFNDHQNRTPVFETPNNVRFDAVPETNLPGTETEHFNIRQSSFETGAAFAVFRRASLRVGYILDDVKRSGRAFSDMTDYTYRVSLDTYGNQYVKLRGVYENTHRVGNGFSEAAIEDAAAQGGLRFYDEADMDRQKGSLVLQVTPNGTMDLGLSLAAGKDIYKGEGHEFGLLSNRNTSYNATLTAYPTDRITVGGSYGYETFKSLQTSRNANPVSGVPGAYESFNDPNRNWSLDNDETVKNLGLFLDLLQALPNTDIRFSYDYSNSDNAFRHSGPRIQELLTNTALTTGDVKPCATGLTSCFEALPNVTNSWKQMRVDVKHMFSPKVGVGVGYWYEKFDIVDFATTNLADGSPRIDPLGAIRTGYGNRPYKGQTGMVRVIYIF